MTELRIEYHDEDVRRVLGARLAPALAAAVKAIATEVQHRIAPYPPASEANSPDNPRGRWYERGYGPRWWRKDGSMGGSKTSETLGRRWTIRQAGVLSSVVENRASYAADVHSHEKQALFHRRRGWRTDAGVVESIERDGTARALTERAVLRQLEIRPR